MKIWKLGLISKACKVSIYLKFFKFHAFLLLAKNNRIGKDIKTQSYGNEM